MSGKIETIGHFEGDGNNDTLPFTLKLTAENRRSNTRNSNMESRIGRHLNDIPPSSESSKLSDESERILRKVRSTLGEDIAQSFRGMVMQIRDEFESVAKEASAITEPQERRRYFFENQEAWNQKIFQASSDGERKEIRECKTKHLEFILRIWGVKSADAL